MLNVGIIGSGYVGLVTGACLAHLGHRVLCVDNDSKKIESLRRGKTTIYEPGLQVMVQQNLRKKKMTFSGKIEQAVKECDILFICVNTPPKPNGEADLSFVENVSREIAVNLKKYRLIVEKSTVPVQTGRWIHKTVATHQPDETLFDVASNPEFLREGSAIHDFLHPDRVVLGVANARSLKLLKQLYAPLKAKLVVTDLKSAEIIKHASNSFLATKISFINMVSRICDATGADVFEVAQGMGLDPRIGKSFLQAGIGFGGSCFPKDLSAFHRIAERLGVSFDLLDEVLKINREQKNYFVKKIENTLWNLNNKSLAVLGLSFKPDTDDIRSAPARDIIEGLVKEGAHVKAYDPQAMPKFRREVRNIRYAKSAMEAIRDADALVLLTEWEEFLKLDYRKVKKVLKRPIIFDGRNMLNPKKIRSLGFQYIGVGRPMVTMEPKE